MDWKNYSNDEVVAKIRYMNNKMEFTWLGFYNTKSKKRDYIDNPFTGKIGKSSIILQKCKK
ncbi:putative methionine-R-sulfoxide reductase with GAF domain [Flavobacterium sp. 7E]|nr:putative methionine-R-sulfoxide reductase with GAF domain [Flavobacterium sp. 7E]